MAGLISEVKDFYVFYHTSAEIKPKNTKEWVIKTSLCKRDDFMFATFDALEHLIYNIALTILSAIAVIATLGLKPSCKVSLRENAYDAIVHACSIPVSLLGIISPQTINQSFLKITPHKFKHAIKPGVLTEAAGFLGGITIRQRRLFNSHNPRLSPEIR